jgi:hypothetical protein
MKNIYSVISDNPTRLSNTHDGNLVLDDTRYLKDYQNLYIISADEIKDCYVLNTRTLEVYFSKGWYGFQRNTKRIILTTDQTLIDTGIQKIDGEFLQWYVGNSDHDFVEVTYDKDVFPYGVETANGWGWYVIKIPQNKTVVDEMVPEVLHEGKELTTAEVMGARSNAYDFINFDKSPEEETLSKVKFVLSANNDAQAIRLIEQYGVYRVEKMYSDDDVLNLLYRYQEYIEECTDRPLISIDPKNWFVNNKK